MTKNIRLFRFIIWIFNPCVQIILRKQSFEQTKRIDFFFSLWQIQSSFMQWPGEKTTKTNNWYEVITISLWVNPGSAASQRNTPASSPPHSLFFILPFFCPPRPKPDFLTSPTHRRFLDRSFFIPPPCRNCCFCCFLRCVRICLLDFSSERTIRPPGVRWAPAELWVFGPRWPWPRPDRWVITKSSSLVFCD